MKRGKKLIVLLVVLALIVGATVLVSVLNPEEEPQGSGYTTVFSLDPEKVTNLYWDYSYEASFSRTEDGWVNDADAAFPTNNDQLDQMVRILSEVGASQTIENVEDLEQYGLLYPVCQIKVTVDGTTYELALGDQNNYSGERYFTKGDGNVYTVANDIVNYFAYGQEGVLQMEEIPLLSGVTALKMESAQQTYNIAYEPGTDRTYSSKYRWFMDGKVLDTELTEALLAVLEALEWKECADYNATDLAQYGLDQPAGVITTTRLDENFVLELGAKTEKGYYARIAGSKMVYLVSSSTAETLLYTSYNELMPDEVLLMDWDTLQSVEITMKGQTYKINSMPVGDVNGCATGEMAWNYNDKQLDSADVKNKLDNMKTVGYATGLTPEMEEELRLVFQRDDTHHQTVELVFYRHNSEACLVTLDGVSTVLADRTAVTYLIKAIETMLG